ncbi:MAG TPA: hypothetical protein VMM38_11180 [Aridibacter sp.]|nr:hypothetical protein [Aridibacter sp.]
MNFVPPKHFRNEGFGWTCRRCTEQSVDGEKSGRSRLMTEGESEMKPVELSTPALAKWADRNKSVLECPRCGTRERIPEKR